MIGPFVFAAIILLLSVTGKKADEPQTPPPAQLSEKELGEAIAHLLVDMKKQQTCK